jgi:hypothetical protein
VSLRFDPWYSFAYSFSFTGFSAGHKDIDIEIEIVSYFMSKNAEINIEDKEGKTADE